MQTRSLLQAAFEIGHRPASQLPPTFLLPFRARLLHQASAISPTQFQNTSPEIPPHILPSSELPATNPSEPLSTQLQASPSPLPSFLEDLQPSSRKPLVLSKSLQTLLPLLEAQKPHYISAHIHRFPYLLTPGDTVRLPFHMHGVKPGDILRLNRASILGSRDYTLKAGTNATESYDGKRTGEPQYLDERLFECRVRVLGLDSGPMMTKEKTKRRNRKVKTVKSKHKFTMLKVMEVKIKGLEALEKGTDALLLE